MGQAFNEHGRVIAEAFGKTKKEVFDKLIEAAPNAAEIKVKTLIRNIQHEEMPGLGDEVACPDMGERRELAATILRRVVENLKSRLSGLESLLKIAESAESGSPLEEALWNLLTSQRNCQPHLWLR